MDYLDQLENTSVHILREAYANFKNLGMLWSIGKDSTVLLWLTRKAFLGHVPFTLIHIDTNYKIPEMISYRDQLVAKWNLDLIYGMNEKALRDKMRRLEEKEIVMNKELMLQILASEKNIKKGKIKEFKY